MSEFRPRNAVLFIGKILSLYIKATNKTITNKDAYSKIYKHECA